MSERFPWESLMRLGMGRLGLSPRDFWSMTLKELHAALSPTLPMARDDLDRLMDRYPDDL